MALEKYTQDVHIQLVETLNNLTDTLLSQGVSDTTYAFSEKSYRTEDTITKIKRLNHEVPSDLIDQIFQENQNHNIAISSLRNMGFKTEDGGIKQFAKGQTSIVIDTTLHHYLTAYNMPPSVRSQIEAFKIAFQRWEEQKETTLSQSNHDIYFDENVINFRTDIDRIIQDTATLFKNGPKTTFQKSDNGVQTTVKEIITSIEQKARMIIPGTNEANVAQFMAGFLDAIQTQNVANFLKDPDTVQLLGGQVKALRIRHELTEQGQQISNLLTGSSKQTANLVFREEKERYNLTFAQSL